MKHLLSFKEAMMKVVKGIVNSSKPVRYSPKWGVGVTPDNLVEVCYYMA